MKAQMTLGQELEITSQQLREEAKKHMWSQRGHWQRIFTDRSVSDRIVDCIIDSAVAKIAATIEQGS